MRISASTNSHEKYLWAKEIKYSCEEAIRALHKAGFRVVDINLHSYSQDGEPLDRDDWREWSENLRKVADSLGVQIAQAHAPFYGIDENGAEDPHKRLMMERAIEAAHICGVKRMVFHPFNVTKNGWFCAENAEAYNMKLFREYADLCRPYGIRIAIENMIESLRGRRYCSAEDELIALVDALNDPIFGICWDFGHGHMNNIDQVAALRKVGKRLICLHVDDNNGKYDDHLTPYLGTICWEPLLEVLKEIEYDGDWTYEIHNFHNGLPDAMQDAALEYTYKLAQYMVSL